MFPLGLLSIVQVAFLPGWIALRVLGMAGGGALRTVALAFPLSLLFNHLVVFGLTAAGANVPPVLWGLFISECLLALFLLSRGGAGATALADEGSDLDRLRGLVQGLLDGPRPRMVVGLLGLAAAATAFAVCLGLAVEASSSVFSHWDAVVSWNRWAVDWYNSRLPELTWNYPQLIPTTISTTYTFAATSEIQFFAMGVMALFLLVLLMALADLALRTGLVRYAWGAALVGLIFPRYMGEFSMAGYADEPVAVMTALTLYVLLLGSRAGGWEEARRYVFVGALCAAATALTKQAGWHLAVLYPVLAALIVRGGGLGDRLRAVVGAAVVIVVVAGPWHLYRYLVPAGNEMPYVLKIIHGDRTFVERAVFAAEAAARALGWPVWLLSIAAPAALALSLLDRSWRWITLLVTLPLVVVWLFFIGYTHRNSAVAAPLTLVAGAVGVARLLELLPRPSAEARAGWVRIAAIAVVATAVVWPAFTVFRYSQLLKAQLRQQREIGLPQINSALYTYAGDPGFDGKIVSNYQVLPWLPEFEDLYAFHSLQEPRGLERLLDLPDHRFLLYKGGMPLPGCVQDLVGRGRLTEVRTGPGFALFRAEPAAPAGGVAAGAP